MENLKMKKKAYKIVCILNFLIGLYIVWKVKEVDRKILWSFWLMNSLYGVLVYKWNKFNFSYVWMIDIVLFSGVRHLKIVAVVFLHSVLFNIFMDDFKKSLEENDVLEDGWETEE